MVSDSLPLLKDSHVKVAAGAMYPYDEARDWLINTTLQSKVEGRAREALRPLGAGAGQRGSSRRGRRSRRDAPPRSSVSSTTPSQDPAVRAAFAPRGAALLAGGKLNVETADPALVGIMLRTYVRADGPAEWETMNKGTRRHARRHPAPAQSSAPWRTRPTPARRRRPALSRSTSGCARTRWSCRSTTRNLVPSCARPCGSG